MEKALQLAAMANNVWVTSTIKSNIGQLRFCQGAPLVGLEMTRDAIRLAEDSGDILSKSRAYVSHGFCLYGRGLLREAIENLTRGAELCDRADYLAWGGVARNALGEIFCVTREFQDAAGHNVEAIRLIERSEMMPSWLTLCKTDLGLANVMNGEHDVGLESLCRAARSSKAKSCEGWIRRNLGQIFLSIDDGHFPEAQHWLEEAIEADERNGMRWHLVRDIAVYADLFRRKGDRSSAQEQLGKAIGIYTECGADGWVTKAEEELAKLS